MSVEKKAEKQDRAKILAKIPAEGFIKLGAEKTVFDKAEDRVALIRKGNEFFNAKRYDLAKRIFITTGYSDGLIRLGDYYWEQKKPLEAFRMYYLAPSKQKVDAMLETMARIVKHWLRESRKE